MHRSCCRSVKATETASCLSTTCCLGRTPVLALPNTSTWTTSVNQVSPAGLICPNLFATFAPLPVSWCSLLKARLMCSRTEEHSYLSLVLTCPFPTFSCVPSLSWTQKACGVWGRGADPALQAPQGAQHLCSCLWEKPGPARHLPFTPDKTAPIWWVNGIFIVLIRLC